MPDLRISQLTPITGGDVEAQDVLPVADVSGSTAKKVRVDDLSAAIFRLIPPGSFDGSRLATDTITALQLAPDSVGASELANGSVDSAAIQTGAVTNTHLAAGIDGAKLTDGSLTAAKLNSGTVGRGLNVTPAGLGIQNAVTPGTSAGVSWNAQGLVTGATPLVGADLPPATTTVLGGVMATVGGGISVSPTGGLSLTNVVGSGTGNGITWDNHGQITAVTALKPADLPAATATAIGGVSVPATGGLLVSGAGSLTLSPSGIAPGSYARVTVNTYGQVTAGGTITLADIPDLSASKITTGTFGTTQIADKSITAPKLADYSTVLIQEAVPSAGVGSHPIGMLWLQESTGQVSIWNGNSWMKTGASTLFNRNLRYAGSYNASTGIITGVTQFGTAEGLKVGDTVPAADDKNAGLYFVASVAGSNAGFANNAAMDNGDWLLSHGTAGNWVRIDTLNGAGGGGGGTVSNLDDLLDVTLTAPTQGDFLQLGGSSQWVNVSVLDEGTWT